MLRIAGLLVCAGLSANAVAEVKQSAGDAFEVEHRYSLSTTPAGAWQALRQPARWWPADHTWSGNAGNLSLDVAAGGCFCERWNGSSAEHGRVVMVLPRELLRIDGALGPLQDMGVTGVLTIALKPVGEATEAIVRYRVSGDGLHKLDAMVAAVDQVIGLQFSGFAKFASAQKEK